LIIAPEVGGSYSLSSRFSIGFDAARGFRNPTLRKLRPFPAPNPNPKPETIWNYRAAFNAHLRGSLGTPYSPKTPQAPAFSRLIRR